jgi:adenosylmethionine-8-amino-7-oxononanoate aminotransferase
MYSSEQRTFDSYPTVGLFCANAKSALLSTKDGRTIFDSTAGAAVSCLGHGDKRVIHAITRQMETGITYIATTFFGNSVVEALCKEIINGTGRQMTRVYLTGSGMSQSAFL